MKKYYLFSVVLTGLLCASCEQESDLYPRTMQGTVSIIGDEYIVGGTETTFRVGNAIKDPADNLTFVWDAPGFAPSTGTGESFRTVAPQGSAEHAVILTAQAAGYRNVVKEYRVTLAGCEPIAGGKLVITGPTGAGMGENVVFKATLAGAALPDGVHFRWTALNKGFTDSTTGDTITTATGAEFSANLSRKQGTYTLQLDLIDPTGHYCPLDPATAVISNNCQPMAGTLKFTINPSSGMTVPKDNLVTLVATGITNPSSDITYRWSSSLPLNSTTGSQVDVYTPGTSGQHDVVVTASAPGYCEVTYAGTVTVSDCFPLFSRWTVAANGDKEGDHFRPGTDVSFTMVSTLSPNVSKNGIEYMWSAPGLIPETSSPLSGNETWSARIPATSAATNYMVTVTATSSDAAYCPASTHVLVPVNTVSMTGTPAIAVTGQEKDGSLRPGAQVIFRAGGITKPADGLTYEWRVSHNDDLEPKTATGAEMHYTVPTTATRVHVTLTATAESFIDKQTAVSYDVKKPAIPGIRMDISGAGHVNNDRLHADHEVIFTAAGLSDDLQPAASFTWNISGAGAVNGVTSGLTHTFPAQAARYPVDVMLTVKVPNYRDTNLVKRLEVDCTPMGGTLALTADPGTTVITGSPGTLTAGGITSPTSGITYSLQSSDATLVVTRLTAISAQFQGAVSGNYNVTVSAAAPGFCVMKTTQSVSVREILTLPKPLIQIESNSITQEAASVYGVPSGAQLSLSAERLETIKGVTYTWEIMKGTTTVSTTTTTDRKWSTALPNEESTFVIKLRVNAALYNPEVAEITVKTTNSNMGALLIKATGAPNSALPDEFRTGIPVTFTATGAEHITGATYTWSIDGAPQAPQTDPALTRTFGTPRQYTIGVKVTAPGFAPLSSSKTITVAEGIMGPVTIDAVGTTNTDGSYRPGKIVFTAGGISAAGAVYSWSVDGIVQAATTGKTLDYTFDDTKETGHTIGVVVTAPNYAMVSHTIDITVIPGSLGTLTIVKPTGNTNPDGSYQPNRKVPFTTEGINIPANYTWTVNGTPQLAYKGKSMEYTFAATGDYTIGVMAEVPGYFPSIAEELMITVTASTLTGAASIAIAGTGTNPDGTYRPGTEVTLTATGMSQPGAEALTYHWTIPGFESAANAANAANTPSCKITLPVGTQTIYNNIEVAVSAPGYYGTVTSSPAQVTARNGEITVSGGITVSSASSHSNYEATRTLRFTAPAAVTPAAVGYEWKLQDDGFSNVQYVNRQGTNAVAPATPDMYDATVILTAPGYNPKTISRSVQIACRSFDGRLVIDRSNNPAVVNDIVMLNKNSTEGAASSVTLTAVYQPSGNDDEPTGYDWYAGGTLITEGVTANRTATTVTLQQTLASGVITVRAKRDGSCELPAANTVNYQQIDCPYTAADLVLSNRYRCRQRTEFGESDIRNWEAWMQDPVDGKIYRIVRMGLPSNSTSRWWFAQNLERMTSAADLFNPGIAPYGYYYKADAMSTGKNPCPTGWKVPTDSEWADMISSVNGDQKGTQLRIKDGGNPPYEWMFEGSIGRGTDTYGFSATPAGRYNTSNVANRQRENAYFWVANGTMLYELAYDDADIVQAMPNNNLHPIRCIKE